MLFQKHLVACWATLSSVHDQLSFPPAVLTIVVKHSEVKGSQQQILPQKPPLTRLKYQARGTETPHRPDLGTRPQHPARMGTMCCWGLNSLGHTTQSMCIAARAGISSRHISNGTATRVTVPQGTALECPNPQHLCIQSIHQPCSQRKTKSLTRVPKPQ